MWLDSTTKKLNMEDPEDKVVLRAVVAGLTNGRFSFLLGNKSPKMFKEFIEKAQNAEDMVLT